MVKNNIFLSFLGTVITIGFVCFGAAEPMKRAPGTQVAGIGDGWQHVVHDRFVYADLLDLTKRKIEVLPHDRAIAGNRDERANQIIRGGDIADCILNDRVMPFNVHDRVEYLRAVIDLMWYFYSEAINKGQAFSEGTFVLSDTGFRFYKFLMNYVTLVNPSITANPLQDPAKMMSDNPYADSRMSSHYTTLQYGNSDAKKIAPNFNGRYRHYGIEIRWDTDADYNALPTTNKSHILFGKIHDKPAMIFIKMEQAGIYQPPTEIAHPTFNTYVPVSFKKGLKYLPGPELCAHGVHFVQSQTRKGIGSAVGPQGIDSLRGVFNFDDNPTNRKEHCPPACVATFKEAAPKSWAEAQPDLLNAYNALVDQLGIKFVYLLIKFVEERDQSSLDLLASFTRTFFPGKIAEEDILFQLTMMLDQDSEFSNKLKVAMASVDDEFDHRDIRTGREIILKSDGFESTARYYHERVNAVDERKATLSEGHLLGLQNQRFGQRIVLKNNTARILIEITRRDARNPSKIIRWNAVVEEGASIDIGSSDSQDASFPLSVAYVLYGRYTGGSALTHIEDAINEFLADHRVERSQHLVVSVNKNLGLSFSQKPCEKNKLISVLDAFAGVKYHTSYFYPTWETLQQKTAPAVFARYVLGLPEEYTEMATRIRYERLLNEWDPALYPENAQLCRAIIEIIKGAYEALAKK